MRTCAKVDNRCFNCEALFTRLDDRKLYGTGWTPHEYKPRAPSGECRTQNILAQQTQLQHTTKQTSPKICTRIATAHSTRNTSLNNIHMAQSITTTEITYDAPTKKPQLKLAVPSLTPQKSDKQPWESLLMGDPGSDYDQHESRVNTVDYMLSMAAGHGVYAKMINWRNTSVFVDDDEVVKTPTKRTDSGINMREGSESSEDVEKVTFKKEKSIWNDTNSVWREADKVKGEDDFNEYGLWYGKPWAVST